MAIAGFKGEYRWLSNFWPVAVVFEGDTYPSTEHAYQAAKTLDPAIREAIRVNPKGAGGAKKIGKNLWREDWPGIRLRIMEQLNRQKYARHDLKARLLATGDEEIIELNTWGDIFWGVCDGIGENHLGKIIMRIRGDLRAAVQLQTYGQCRHSGEGRNPGEPLGRSCGPGPRPTP
jgi:ribA/ribD-fused uncharacterized protein